MFIVHGSDGSIDVIVGTSNPGRAILHHRRLVKAGLTAFITDDTGRTCDPCILALGVPIHDGGQPLPPLPKAIRVRT